MKVLTARHLNRALLARQMLLERVDLPVPRVLERMAGLQAQYAPSMYIGLWTRIAGFPREQLTDLLERRVVVQGTLQRSTIHLVSREDYWPFELAVREARLASYLRVAPPVDERFAARLREVLLDGPLKRADMDKLFGAASRIGLHLMVSMVRIPPSGTWARRRADLYASASSWIGAPPPSAGLAHVVTALSGGFGPATARSFSDWIGLPLASVTPALESLTLRRFRAEDGAELLDLPRAPLPDPDTPAPVRFLPTYDATLLAHARRALILPGGAPVQGVQHQDAAVDRHVHGRRRGRRDLAVRGRTRGLFAVRVVTFGGTARSGRRGRPADRVSSIESRPWRT